MNTNIEIRVLKYFLQIAREKNLTKAAQILHVTQPTLSRQLKELEDKLGHRLFTRASHSIALTPEGLLLQKRAEEILNLVYKTESEFQALGNTITGNVYIGCGETDAMNLIAKLIRSLQQEYPEIHYHLFSGNAKSVIEQLDKGTLDFGILIEPVNVDQYHVLQLPKNDIWGVIMRKDDLLAKKKSINFDDLSSLPLICSRQAMEESHAQTPYAKWFRNNMDQLNIVATYNLIYNASLLVQQGVGYAIALDKLISETNSNNLTFRPLEPALHSNLCFAWKRHHIFSDAAKLFLSRLKSDILSTQ